MQVIKDEGSRPIKAWVGTRKIVDLENRLVDFATVPDIEASALTQLKNLARLPFIHSNGVAVMPDVHAGIGSTVGTVIATDKAIIPAAVGVDIGCVDADTEYLSPTGWKRIADYDGSPVAQYSLDTGIATFIVPFSFVKKPAKHFWHLKTRYGVDQMLSGDHRVLHRKTARPGNTGKLCVITADQLAELHGANVLGFSGKFLTTFSIHTQTRLDLSDADLRVMAMVCADGAFDARRNSLRCVLQFTKERKLLRAVDLLTAAEIEFKRDDLTDDRGLVHRVIFNAPMREKSLGAFWSADAMQLETLAMEAMKWDGWDNRVYYTRDKPSADFMQYALSACGYRAVMREDEREGGVDYRVFANANIEVGMRGTPKTPIVKVDGAGQFQYCFSVPSSYWIMRRGGNVAITGNCGMNAVRLTLKASDLPDNLSAIRNAIEKAVPLGAGGQKAKGKHDIVGWDTLPATLFEHHKSIIDPIFGSDVYKFLSKASPQLGTLGSGNHFIELCVDENQDVWVMLHSGSRGIGNMIGRHYIEKAKRNMEKFFISLPDTDLAYFPEDTEDFNDYVAAVKWAQDYALENRRVMMVAVLAALRDSVPKAFLPTTEAVSCHHNYVEKENHFGRNLWVTRKGAVQAREGQLGIIPGSMGQKSYIVRGKGNLESYCSCSHGAGRQMSRTEAKRRFSLVDLIAQTDGVECRKDESVLDEIPGAYKSLDTVMANQADLVEVVHVLKAVLCVKGN